MDTILRRGEKKSQTLPVKFRCFLAQGRGGNCRRPVVKRFFPTIYNEILDAIAYLHNEPFSLLPDFQTGGRLDASRYNDGARGGKK